MQGTGHGAQAELAKRRSSQPGTGCEVTPPRREGVRSYRPKCRPRDVETCRIRGGRCTTGAGAARSAEDGPLTVLSVAVPKDRPAGSARAQVGFEGPVRTVRRAGRRPGGGTRAATDRFHLLVADRRRVRLQRSGRGQGGRAGLDVCKKYGGNAAGMRDARPTDDRGVVEGEGRARGGAHAGVSRVGTTSGRRPRSAGRVGPDPRVPRARARDGARTGTGRDRIAK